MTIQHVKRLAGWQVDDSHEVYLKQIPNALVAMTGAFFMDEIPQPTSLTSPVPSPTRPTQTPHRLCKRTPQVCDGRPRLMTHMLTRLNRSAAATRDQRRKIVTNMVLTATQSRAQHESGVIEQSPSASSDGSHFLHEVHVLLNMEQIKAF